MTDKDLTGMELRRAAFESWNAALRKEYREPTLEETGRTTEEQLVYLEQKFGQFPPELRQEMETLAPWTPTPKPDEGVSPDSK